MSCDAHEALMFLKKIEGLHFRNYEKLSLEFNKPLNIFTGDNGQGKSSFLEALYCGLRGKSFYPFITTQIIQEGQNHSFIHLNLEEESGSSSLSARFFLTEKGLKKELFYCDKKVGPRFLSRKIPCFVFTEESMKCIRQGREQRLNFVDEMLEEERAKRVKEDFNKILKQKRAILKQAQRGEISLASAKRLLKALNPLFLQSSFQLVQERLKLLKKLFTNFKELKREFFDSPFPELAFSYGLQEGTTFSESSDINTLLKEDLEQKEEQELRAGLSLSGPQKHELLFLFNGKDSRTFCSKGQQRALLLSLLASHIQSQPKGFLFLDDVLLELDEKTGQKFLHFLEKNHCQTFLTNCKIIPFKTENTSLFSVKKGIVTRQ